MIRKILTPIDDLGLSAAMQGKELIRDAILEHGNTVDAMFFCLKQFSTNGENALVIAVTQMVMREALAMKEEGLIE